MLRQEKDEQGQQVLLRIGGGGSGTVTGQGSALYVVPKGRKLEATFMCSAACELRINDMILPVGHGDHTFTLPEGTVVKGIGNTNPASMVGRLV